jgi:hypothetical protein
MKRIAMLTLAVAAASVLVVIGFAGSGAQGRATATFGNHNLNGLYEFQADGMVEVNGEPRRGFWEVGRFRADGAGRITGGIEHSSMLSEDEETIDRPFTFEGTYQVHPTGVATGNVTVVVAPGVEIRKKLWLILHSIGKRGIANGFDGGHAHADLGGGTHGNALTHVGHRVEIAK